jgi:hypothetical protein
MAKRKKQQKPNAEYDLQPMTFHPDTKRMLGLDPGSRNMGISLAAANAKDQVKIIRNAIVTSPVDDLVNFMASREVFLTEIARWIHYYEPHGIIAERFQTRGGANMGALSEKVTVMLGLIAGRWPSLPIKLITAATWKNDYQRRFEFQLDDIYPVCLATPHQLDSSFIATYGLETGLQRKLKFTPESIMRDVETSSAVRLINRKTRS